MKLNSHNSNEHVSRLMYLLMIGHVVVGATLPLLLLSESFISLRLG